MTKVYILTSADHDYSDAERFGELVFIDTPPSMKWDISALYKHLMKGLDGAEYQDYFIINHITSVCCVATAILTECFGQVNFLIFRHDKYEHHTLVTMDVEVE